MTASSCFRDSTLYRKFWALKSRLLFFGDIELPVFIIIAVCTMLLGRRPDARERDWAAFHLL
jgi:hypothetical protein